MIGISISDFDVFKKGKVVYHIDRVVRETGQVESNGLQEIYVNAKLDDGSDVAELMKIYKEQNTYNFKKFPKTSKRKEYFLRSERGRKEMCEALDNLVKEERLEEAKEIARNLFEKGASYELVKASIDSLSDEELKRIYDEAISK